MYVCIAVIMLLLHIPMRHTALTLIALLEDCTTRWKTQERATEDIEIDHIQATFKLKIDKK
jgi:hypothetical protein